MGYNSHTSHQAGFFVTVPFNTSITPDDYDASSNSSVTEDAEGLSCTWYTWQSWASQNKS
jgi:hypothetical protein